MHNELKPDLLIPQFTIDEVHVYEITKREGLAFGASSSEPFERRYQIEIRQIDTETFEIYYPDSVLSASKYFQPIEVLLAEMRHAQNCTIYVSITEDHTLELQNHQEIQTHLQKLQQNLMATTKDEALLEAIDAVFDHLSSKEQIEKYFLEDLPYLFDYYGLEKEDDVYFDFTPKKNVLGKLAKTIGLGLGSLDVLMLDVLENQHFKIESIKGKDTVSDSARHNFKDIKEGFLHNELAFDALHHISLHHKVYVFNTQNILESFIYRFKIHTAKMYKMKEVRIARGDYCD